MNLLFVTYLQFNLQVVKRIVEEVVKFVKIYDHLLQLIFNLFSFSTSLILEFDKIINITIESQVAIK